MGRAIKTNINLTKALKYEESKLLLFASYDLVGSTAFKTRNPKDWAGIFSNFFTDLCRRINQYKNGAFKIWKLNGDELLFYIEIKDKSAVKEAVSFIYKTLKELIPNLHEMKLDVQATAWLVMFGDSGNIRNIIIPEGSLFNSKVREFLGPNVDEGFRVAASFARQRKLALSFALSYILSCDQFWNEKIFCVGMEKLKGVWNNRHYPVIWYTENINEDIKETPYDLEFDCKFTRCFIEKPEKITRGKLEKIVDTTTVNMDHLSSIKDLLQIQ